MLKKQKLALLFLIFSFAVFIGVSYEIERALSYGCLGCAYFHGVITLETHNYLLFFKMYGMVLLPFMFVAVAYAVWNCLIVFGGGARC